MSNTRRAPKRPAGIDFESDGYVVSNSFDRSSGDDAARAAGSTAANSDVTVSEESDSDTETEGK